MTSSIKYGVVSAVAWLVISTSVQAAPVTLISETFEGVDFGGGSIFNGVPTIADGADNDWYGALFEDPNDDNTSDDIGVNTGVSGTNERIGFVGDDSGFLIPINTADHTNINVSFQYQIGDTAVMPAQQDLVFGYFIGDLMDVIAPADPAARIFDLRNEADGGADGVWNWDPQDNGGNAGQWIEEGRFSGPTATDSLTQAIFDLPLDNAGLVWLAVWLDDSDEGFAKLDNFVVTGMVVPLPAALPLLLTGLLGFALVRRRPA